MTAPVRRDRVGGAAANQDPPRQRDVTPQIYRSPRGRYRVWVWDRYLPGDFADRDAAMTAVMTDIGRRFRP